MSCAEFDISAFLVEQKHKLKREKEELAQGRKISSENVPDGNVSNDSTSSSLSQSSGNSPGLNLILSQPKDPSINPFKFYDQLNFKKDSIPKASFPESKASKEVHQILNVIIPEDKENSAHNMQQLDKHVMVDDNFYTFFPSLHQSYEKIKESLSHARKLEYQEYLTKIPDITAKNKHKLTNNKNNFLESGNEGFSPTITKNYENNVDPLILKGSPRHKFIENLKHVDLPSITNPDTIEDRNKQDIAEKTRKKMEYQKELIRQIEDKRKEVELLREKEKREEEMLTKRLEQQLKTMQLEEDLEQEKTLSENTRLTNEKNHILRMQLLSKLENDYRLYNPYDENRKTMSENGKELYRNPEDRAKQDQLIYRYFSNSAKYDSKLANIPKKPHKMHNESLKSQKNLPQNSQRLHRHEASKILDVDQILSNDVRYQYCKGCRKDINDSYSLRSITENGELVHKDSRNCLMCFLKKNDEKSLCRDCMEKFKSMIKQKHNHQAFEGESSDKSCFNCKRKPPNVCIGCRTMIPVEKPKYEANTIVELTEDEASGSDFEVYATNRNGSGENFQVSVSLVQPLIVSRNDNNPYSMNLDQDSIFYPHKVPLEPKVAVKIRNGEVSVGVQEQHERNEELEKLRRLSNDRITKYYQNYGDLRNTRANLSVREQLSNRSSGQMSQISHVSKVSISKQNTDWDYSSIESYPVQQKPKVLTQLGAIRKQLQLEQMKMDKE